ncbi:unnamed protein product [Diamesa tonsa]
MDLNSEVKQQLEQQNYRNISASLSLDDIRINFFSHVIAIEPVRKLRKLLSMKDPPINAVIEMGFVPKLVEYLDVFVSPAIQMEAAWALTNICSGSSEQSMYIIKEGAVGKFVNLLKSPNADVSDQCVWALGNIAGDGFESRDIILNLNVVDILISKLENNIRVKYQRNIVWLMLNLCRGKPSPPIQEIEKLLPILVNFILHKDCLIVSDACWALATIADDGQYRAQLVLEQIDIEALIELFSNVKTTVIAAALRCVGNILTGNDLQVAILLSYNIVNKLAVLFEHKDTNIIKEVTWAISNIAAGSEKQIQTLLDSGIFEKLVNVLKNGDAKSQYEAAWAIVNATKGGSTEQVKKMIEKCKIMEPFCVLLRTNDPKIMTVILDGIANIFRVHARIQDTITFCEILEGFNIVNTIKSLQDHVDDEIHKLSFQIIDSYFSGVSLNIF